MNILTIPLVAIGIFCVALSYHQLNDDKKVSPTPIAPSANEHAGHDHENQTQGDDWRSPGKPSASIELVSEGIYALGLMQPKSLEVVLQSHLTEGTVTVTIQTDGPLQLVSATREWSFDLAKNQEMTLPIEVIANSGGVHHMNIFIEHQAVDGTQTPRALAVEFKVGSGVEPVYSKQEISASATYPTVISLPVAEEIY
jgi:hypothetical protein